MKAHGTECCHVSGGSRSGWAPGATGGTIFAVLVALMPKCPMCIAAWLSVIGLSGLAVRVGPRALLTLALAAALVAGVAGAAGVRRFLGRGRRAGSTSALPTVGDTKKGERT